MDLAELNLQGFSFLLGRDYYRNMGLHLAVLFHSHIIQGALNMSAKNWKGVEVI